jgi:hypothetical protein
MDKDNPDKQPQAPPAPEDNISKTESYLATSGHNGMLDNLDETLILYLNKERALSGLHTRFKKLVPGLVFIAVLTAMDLYSLSYLQDYSQLPWLSAGLAILVIFLTIMYVLQRASLAKSGTTILEMRSDGLVIHSFLVDFSLIPWIEIKEVQVYGRAVPCVGIVPVDLKTTLAHAQGSLATRIICWTNAVVLIPACRLLGHSLAPINILEEYFSLSANEVAEQIKQRKEHALKNTAS